MLLERSCSNEVFRGLSLFVTYALYRGRSVMRKPHRDSMVAETPHVETSNTGSRLENGSTNGASHECLSYSELGILILDLYSDLLCTTQDANIKKFARTVTNRVSKSLEISEES